MEPTLTFLLDADDLAAVMSRHPAALHGTVVAFDLEVHLLLLDRGIAHVTPWDFVGRDEGAAVLRFEDAILEFWDRHASLPYEGIDLLRMTRMRHVRCFSRLAWVVYVVRKVLASVHAERVVAFEQTGGHGLDQPPGHRKMPLLHALVRGMAEQAGLEIRLIRPEAGTGAPGFVDHAALASATWRPMGDGDRTLPDGPYVLFVGSGIDLTRQLPVIRALQGRGEVPVVQVYRSASQAILRELKTVGHDVRHESELGVEVAPALDAQSLARARQAFDHAAAAALPDLQCVFANPYMDIHFDFIFGEYASKMARHVTFWRQVLADHPPRLVVANYPVPAYEVAQQLGFPCLGLAHGVMTMGNRPSFANAPCSFVGAVSEPHRSRLLAAGVAPDSVFVTGDPGLDLVLGAARLNRTREVAGHCRRRILVATVDQSSPAMIVADERVHWLDAWRCIEALGDIAARHPEWEIVLKCHPRYDRPWLYERINSNLPQTSQLYVVDKGALADLMPSLDAVVFANLKSSAIVEASMWDRPVLIWNEAMSWIDQSRWRTDRWPQVASAGELESTLIALLSDPGVYQHLVRQTRAALHAFFGGEPKRSAPRCADLITRLAIQASSVTAPAMLENSS